MFSFKKAVDGQDVSQRYFIGLHLSSSLRKLEIAAISCDSARPDSRIFLHKSASYDLPEEITTCYGELLELVRTAQDAATLGDIRENKTSESGERASVKSALKPTRIAASGRSLEKLALLRAMIETIQEEAIRELTADLGVFSSKIVAIALNDPGLWLKATEWNSCPSYYSLSDAPFLASRLGVNVVNGFVPNDWSPSGHGRAFLTIPYWILLSVDDRARLLLDLGETARWTYLPPSRTPGAWKQSLYKEIAPCGSLLNLFAYQASKGQASIDAGGKLSVQGRRPEGLLDFWKEAQNHALKSGDISSRYYSTSGSGIFNEFFYLDALKSARPRKYSSLDALCASVYWIADQIKDSLDSQGFADSCDVILSGASKQNGLLFSKISDLLKKKEFHSLSEYGFLEDSFDSVAVAILGLLLASNSEATYSGMFDVRRDNPLGTITPGERDSWRRFLEFARA